MNTLMWVLLGLGLGAIMAWLGKRIHLLTRSGQIAIIIISAVVFGAKGWVWGLIILLYLVGSGGVILFRQGFKATISDRFWDGAALNGLRIAARLGWPAVLAFLSLTVVQADYFIAFVGAIATAAADTWATELGVLGNDDPRLITTGRPVPPGTAGAVSLLGIFAAFGAAWLIGFISLVLRAIQSLLAQTIIQPNLLWLPLGALLGGLVGSLTDSLLGATAQAIYYCEECKKYTEEPVHTCGHEATPVRGWPWMTNEVIDFVGVVVGAAVTVATVSLLA